MTDYIFRFAKEYGLEPEEAKVEIAASTERAQAFKESYAQAQRERIQRLVEKQAQASAKASVKEVSKEKKTPEQKALEKEEKERQKELEKAQKARQKELEKEEKAQQKARDAQQKALLKEREAFTKSLEQVSKKVDSAKAKEKASAKAKEKASAKASDESKANKRAKVITDFSYEPPICDIPEETLQYLQVALFYLLNFKKRDFETTEEMIRKVLEKKLLRKIVLRLREKAVLGDLALMDIDDYIETMKLYNNPVIVKEVPADFCFARQVRFAYWALSDQATQENEVSVSQLLIRKFHLRDTPGEIGLHVLNPVSPKAVSLDNDPSDTLANVVFSNNWEKESNLSSCVDDDGFERNNRDEMVFNSDGSNCCNIDEMVCNSDGLNCNNSSLNNSLMDDDRTLRTDLHTNDDTVSISGSLFDNEPTIDQDFSRPRSRTPMKEMCNYFVGEESDSEEEVFSSFNSNMRASTSFVSSSSSNTFETELMNQLKAYNENLKMYNENVAGIISLLRQKRPLE
jgi:hypothetical protein